jgi:hypothetical protein
MLEKCHEGEVNELDCIVSTTNDHVHRAICALFDPLCYQMRIVCFLPPGDLCNRVDQLFGCHESVSGQKLLQYPLAQLRTVFSLLIYPIQHEYTHGAQILWQRSQRLVQVLYVCGGGKLVDGEVGPEEPIQSQSHIPPRHGFQLQDVQPITPFTDFIGNSIDLSRIVL